MSEPVRLNRYLALCGVGARRKADVIIEEGRVEVNGVRVSDHGVYVSPGDAVTVDGVAVSPAELTYLILNKPKGVLCAVSDRRERIVIDILPGHTKGVGLFPVGRLDKESEGLLLITNDGNFSQEVIHPSKGISKTYEAELRRPLSEELLIKWIGGLVIADRLVTPISVRRLGKSPLGCWFEIVLGEGLKREIREMARALGNDVCKLTRRKIGRLELRDLPPGEFLSVGKEELWRYIKEGKIV